MLPGRFSLFSLLGLWCFSVRATDFDYEITSKAWCDHKCGDEEIPQTEHKAFCINQCLDGYAKVQRFTCEKVHSPSDYCGVDCKDNQCGGIDICCNDTKCGLTCFTPDLTKYQDFPPIPTNVTVSEVKGRTALIHWDSPRINDTIYIIQERHYTGCRFSRYSTTNWAAITRSLALEPPIVMSIKNGTWYQVRVAAVSANGTRGFSEPSQPFRSPSDPSPPQKPNNLQFTAGGMKNNSVWGVLSWESPQSDLPVKRYFVSWSKRLDGEHTPKNKVPIIFQRKALDAYSCLQIGTVTTTHPLHTLPKVTYQKKDALRYSGVQSPDESIVNHRTRLILAYHRRTFFKIRNLQVGVQYFLQIEAQSLCGKRRLFSPKASKVVNITDISNLSLPKALPEAYLREKSHLLVSVSKVMNSSTGLSARVTWNARPNVKYVISWGDNDGNLDNQVVQSGSNFTLTGLRYQKVYSVKIIEKSKGKKGARRTGKAFFVADPACKKVRRHEC